MLRNKFFSALAVLSLVGFAACGGEEADIEATTEEVITTPEVEQVEVPVVTQDTAIVQTEIEAEVEVDTIDPM